MRLKEYIKKVLEEAAPGEINFDLVVGTNENDEIVVVSWVDSPNVTRLKFTVTKEAKE